MGAGLRPSFATPMYLQQIATLSRSCWNSLKPKVGIIPFKQGKGIDHLLEFKLFAANLYRLLNTPITRHK